MAIGTTTALILGGLSAAGQLGGAALAGSAANRAARTQADAATTASQAEIEAARIQADAIMQAAQQANNLQELTYLLGREDLAPWREVGGGALMTLQDLLQPEGYLAQMYPEFQGQMNFSRDQVMMDPGFDFRLQEAQRAIERSAAARGGVLGGRTARELERYAQDYSSGEYQNAYNRTYGEAIDRYNQALERYRTNFGVSQANQGNLYNRLAALAGVGQTATGQTADLGSGYASGAGANLMGATGQAAGLQSNAQRAANDYLTSAAAARASGYVGGANAWGNAIGQLGQLPMQYYTLQGLLNRR